MWASYGPAARSLVVNSIFLTNKPLSVEIGTSGPVAGLSVDLCVRRSKVKVTGSRS